MKPRNLLTEKSLTEILTLLPRNERVGMSVRYFEAEGQKFWEIQVLDTHIQLRFGKLGVQGQTMVKEFGAVEDANTGMEKLIKEKTKKGYAEK